MSLPPLRFEPAPCNLCGAEETTVLYAAVPDRRHGIAGSFALVRCARCRLVRTQPQPAAESIGALYPPSYSSFADGAPARNAAARVARALVRAPYRLRYGDRDAAPPPASGSGRVLDVGCGTGQLLERLAGAGWEVWGLEPNAAAAAAARARLSLPEERIAVVSVEQAQLLPAGFDLVTMSHVLEHLRDPVDVLRSVAQWLCPGGRLRIWLPNVESLESRIFRRYWFGLDVPRHLYHFAPRTIELALERAGLSLVELRPQLQASSLAGSVSHLAGAVRHRESNTHSSPGYYASLPVASLAAAAGGAAVMDVVAERR